MKYICEKCREEVSDSQLFCHNCGSEFLFDKILPQSEYKDIYGDTGNEDTDFNGPQLTFSYVKDTVKIANDYPKNSALEEVTFKINGSDFEVIDYGGASPGDTLLRFPKDWEKRGFVASKKELDAWYKQYVTLFGKWESSAKKN